MHPTSVLITLSGRDRPGVVASFFAALAAHDVDIRDVEQVVIRDRLILAVLFDLRGDPGALRTSVENAAAALGMEGDVLIADAGQPTRRDRSGLCHVTLIGHPLRAGAMSHIAQRLADLGANIESVTQLSRRPASSLEMVVRAPDPATLRAALVRAAANTEVDIAVEPAELRRRVKRLVVLNLESTLIHPAGPSAIDVLAARAAGGAPAAAATERPTTVGPDLADSLRARVEHLAGLTDGDLAAVRDDVRLTPGASTLVRTLRRVGFRVGVVSGGFTFVTDRLVRELGLDFAAANRLEVVDGVVTGRLVGAVLDRAGKAAALAAFAKQFGVPLAQTVAIGDGAHDIDMIEAAGLGVAFNGKAALRQAADTSATLPYLDTVLFVLGITDEDVREPAEVDG